MATATFQAHTLLRRTFRAGCSGSGNFIAGVTSRVRDAMRSSPWTSSLIRNLLDGKNALESMQLPLLVSHAACRRLCVNGQRGSARLTLKAACLWSESRPCTSCPAGHGPLRRAAGPQPYAAWAYALHANLAVKSRVWRMALSPNPKLPTDLLLQRCGLRATRAPGQLGVPW